MDRLLAVPNRGCFLLSHALGIVFIQLFYVVCLLLQALLSINLEFPSKDKCSQQS